MPSISSDRAALCAGCGGKISDRYYLLAVDKQWHMRCLKCCECKLNLESELTCFSKDGSIYCKEDYYRYSLPSGLGGGTCSWPTTLNKLHSKGPVADGPHGAIHGFLKPPTGKGDLSPPCVLGPRVLGRGHGPGTAQPREAPNTFRQPSPAHPSWSSKEKETAKGI